MQHRVSGLYAVFITPFRNCVPIESEYKYTLKAVYKYRIIKYKNRHLQEKCFMKSIGLLFLGIAWILGSIVWFFIIENTAVGLVWLCGGTIELIIALVRRNMEKKSK